MAGRSDDEMLAWTYLARVAEPPSAAVAVLVAELGAVEAAGAIRNRSVPKGHEDALTATEARAGADCAAQDLEAAAKVGARLILPDDEEWPGWPLLALGRAATGPRDGEPLALWVRGPHRLDEVAAESVAVVGARAASSYGESVTARLSGELCDRGWAVISGGAFGIDGAAHRASLLSGGCTTAVLACGIDRAYPTAHSRLLSEIAERGLLVSEYPPGTTAAKHRFITRNRLVAALSEGVVVVEAGKRSGAANTAAWGRRLGRPVGAFPGPVTSATSVDCHRLITDDLAQLVFNTDTVVSMLRPDGGGDPGRGADRDTDLLSEDQRLVHDAIPGRGVATVDEIAYAAGLGVPVVRSALAAMEIAGVVCGDGGGWRLTHARG